MISNCFDRWLSPLSRTLIIDQMPKMFDFLALFALSLSTNDDYKFDWSTFFLFVQRRWAFDSFINSFDSHTCFHLLRFNLDPYDADISLKLTHELQKRKRRKNRTAFSAQQIYALEKRFAHQRYLTPNDRDQIANELQLSPAQVITVRQNFLLSHLHLFCFAVVPKSTRQVETRLRRTEERRQRGKKITGDGRNDWF